MATTAQQAYDAIKKLEANNTFPLPAPNKTVHVGNFDAATGKFKYAIKTVTITETEKSATGKPVILKSTAGEIKLANVVNLRLQFSVTNPKGTFTVAVAGIEVSAAAGGRSVTVDVGLSQSVRTPDGKISTVDGFIRSGTVEALLHDDIARVFVQTGLGFTDDGLDHPVLSYLMLDTREVSLNVSGTLKAVAVPTPGPLPLLATGLGLIALLRRRSVPK